MEDEGRKSTWNKGLTKETNESIKRISDSLKGKVPWNKGIHMWENRVHPRGTLGMEPWNKGLKGRQQHTEEWKRNASEVAKRDIKIRATQFKKGMVTWNKGIQTPKEVRNKQSNSKIKFYKEHPEAIQFWYENTRKNIVVPMKDTKIEIKIQDYLKQLGIEFLTHQYTKEIKHDYQCDILIPIQEGILQKTIIECDGDYWHCNPKIYSNPTKRQLKKIEADNTRTKELIENGWRVIRLWESEIKILDLNKFKERLK